MTAPRRDSSALGDGRPLPYCSVIIVNYNGRPYVERCVRSFLDLDYPAERFELIVVDNGSRDRSGHQIAHNYPSVRLLRSGQNNFGHALNMGVAAARGEYIAFANNDIIVEPAWLSELVLLLGENPNVGCAGGKLLFPNGRINSVGHKALPNFYWEDEGFGQEDHGQYDRVRTVEGVCWAAALFRRACLDHVGSADEDFVLYYEDVDMAKRIRQKGWEILYTPKARATHRFHASSQGTQLVQYFCERARLIIVAKHHPKLLGYCARSSRFVKTEDWDSLHDALLVALKKITELHPPATLQEAVEGLNAALEPVWGKHATDHLLGRLQVVLGHRRLQVAIYDHALHEIGGGQKYGCVMASTLGHDFDVTLVANRSVSIDELQYWYGIPLSHCQLKIVPLPFFDSRGAWVDANLVRQDTPNPFKAVADAVEGYDILVNINQLTMVQPRTPFSIFVCHFPDTPRRCYFVVDLYGCVIVNSRYTAQWVEKLWGIKPTFLLYPPVDMVQPRVEKENIILSVARFEPGGSKKQHTLIKAFEQLHKSHPELLKNWRLVLVGGSASVNPYLDRIHLLAHESCAPVEIMVNVPAALLKSIYSKAKIFWHACGLKESNPHMIEHFGMSIVEAMQNYCAPIIFDGGGQREIVQHGQSGYRFRSLRQLKKYTCELITTPALLETIQQNAYEQGLTFRKERFQAGVRRLFGAIKKEYATIEKPDPSTIVNGQRTKTLFLGPLAGARPPRHLDAIVGAQAFILSKKLLGRFAAWRERLSS